LSSSNANSIFCFSSRAEIPHPPLAFCFSSIVEKDKKSIRQVAEWIEFTFASGNPATISFQI